MTNDETRMTNILSTDRGLSWITPLQRRLLGFGHSDFLRHLSFVIRHFPKGLPVAAPIG